MRKKVAGGIVTVSSSVGLVAVEMTFPQVDSSIGIPIILLCAFGFMVGLGLFFWPASRAETQAVTEDLVSLKRRSWYGSIGDRWPPRLPNLQQIVARKPDLQRFAAPISSGMRWVNSKIRRDRSAQLPMPMVEGEPPGAEQMLTHHEGQKGGTQRDGT